MSQQFRAAVVGQLEDLYTAQLEDVTAVPALDEDFQVEYESLYEETCAALPLPAAPHASSQLLLRDRYVGGIYLRLFLQNPQYNIRKPEKFVEVKASRCTTCTSISQHDFCAQALLQAHEALAQTEGMAKDLGTICTCVLTVLKVRLHPDPLAGAGERCLTALLLAQVRVMMCDHVANLGYMERLMSTEVRFKPKHSERNPS